MWSRPDETAVALARNPVSPPPTTWTGVVLSVVVAFPSWPLSLSPQHQAVWSRSTTHVCDPPAPAAEALARLPDPPAPTTWTGVVLLVVVPFPSWPLSLSPQHHATKSALRARREFDLSFHVGRMV